MESKIRTTVAILAVLAGAVVALGEPRPAESMNWVLALPPSKAGASESRDPRQAVGDALDRTAPIDRWSAGAPFESGEACEDARLQAIKEFDATAEALGGRAPSPDDRRRLSALGRRAFGRCVPAFSFAGDSRP
jgi:hypothetical protein